jgi:hypothetical protein
MWSFSAPGLVHLLLAASGLFLGFFLWLYLQRVFIMKCVFLDAHILLTVCSAHFSTLKMEKIHCLKNRQLHRATRYHIPKNTILYRPRDCLLSAKLVTTFADRVYHVVRATDLYCHILGFLDHSRYFSFKLLLNCTHETEWTPFWTH